MNKIKERIKNINWQTVMNEMNEKGFAVISKFIGPDECRDLIGNYNNASLYRKTITMERYRFGLGEYKYFKYALPEMIQSIREEVYPNWHPLPANGCKS
jgi:uncharacterized protein